VRIRSKSRAEGLKIVQAGQERSNQKIMDKEAAFIREIRTIKMKPSTLPWNNREKCLESISGIVQIPVPLQTQGYKSANTFERISLEKRASEALCSNRTV
jgi:hypothetical protein